MSNSESIREYRKPNNVVVVRTTLDTKFFRWWCILLKPFLPFKLTDRELDLVACFLKHRHILSKSINDDSILNEMMMSKSTTAKVMQECGITKEHLYVIMSNLRKNKVFTGNVIHPKLIPNIREDESNRFEFSVLFDLREK